MNTHGGVADERIPAIANFVFFSMEQHTTNVVESGVFRPVFRLLEHVEKPQSLAPISKSAVPSLRRKPMPNGDRSLPQFSEKGENVILGLGSIVEDEEPVVPVSVPFLGVPLKKERRGDSVSPPEDTPDAKELCECYALLRKHHEVHGFSFHTAAVEERTTKHWMKLAAECGGWLKLMKYKLPAYFASWLGNVPEEAPFGKKDGAVKDDPKRLICSRSLNREFEKICMRENRRRQHKNVKSIDLVQNEGESQEFRNFRSFIVGINYLKKGLPRPSDCDVSKGIVSAMKALFTPGGKGYSEPFHFLEVEMHDFEDGSLECRSKLRSLYPFNQTSITMEIFRTVKELFAGERFTLLDLKELMFPSLRANTTNSIKDGGFFGYLSQEPFLKDLWTSCVPRLIQVTGWREDVGDGVFGFEEYSAIGLSEDEVRRLQDVTFAYLLQLLRETPGFEMLFGDLIPEYMRRGVFDVLPVGLKEPLKVRVITKEPGILMFLLKPIQAWLWRTLARHPVFRLLKEPKVTESTLSLLGLLERGKKILSGDYSGATNNLRGWASRATAMALRENFDNELLSLGIFDYFLVSLVDHVFDNRVDGRYALQRRGYADPLLSDAPYSFLRQTEGQLMGSVTSFPVLCIVNAAVCRMCIERDRIVDDGWFTKPKIELEKCGMLINGDDCVFQVGKVGYDCWIGGCAVMGLLPSVGKFYYSENYLNINSTSFFRCPARFVEVYSDQDSILPVPSLVVSEWTICLYVNWGLITGLKRSAEEVDKVESREKAQLYQAAQALLGVSRDSAKKAFQPIGSISWDLMEATPSWLRQSALDEFVNLRVRPWFSNMSVPWYVPESYGGLGIYPYLRGGMTLLDRQRCLSLKSSGKRNQVQDIKSFAYLPVWKSLLKHLRKDFSPEVLRALQVDSSDGLYSSCLDRFEEEKSIYLSAAPYWLELGDCVESDQAHIKSAMKILAKNRRVWWSLNRVSRLPGKVLSKRFDPWQERVEQSALPLFRV